MLFYLASIIIHGSTSPDLTANVDLFRTSYVDSNISDTSSYLDLSPLYGSTMDEQKLVRTFTDGKLKPDTFSELRVLGFPPGVGALLVCFNRFHNYVVEELAVINEGGRFSPPNLEAITKVLAALYPAWPKEQLKTKAKEKFEADTDARDNNLFQTGRL